MQKNIELKYSDVNMLIYNWRDIPCPIPYPLTMASSNIPLLEHQQLQLMYCYQACRLLLLRVQFLIFADSNFTSHLAVHLAKLARRK